MKLPPVFIRFSFTGKDERKFNLWFPCFLLWPFVLVLLAIPFVCLLLVDLITGFRLRLLKMFWAAILIIVESKGTTVDVRNKSQQPILAIKII